MSILRFFQNKVLFKQGSSYAVIVLLLLLIPLSVEAHKLRIFAWSEGDIIHGETAFSGKRKPKNAEVTVLDAAAEKVLLTTHTDPRGRFSFTIPDQAVKERLNLLLVVNSGEGHRGEWPLPASEYLPVAATDPTASDNVKPVSGQQEPVNESLVSDPLILSTPVSMDEQQLRRIVASEMAKVLDKELEKNIAPLKQMLAENSEKQPGLQDVLGGIGYIIGFAGLLAWLKSRKKENDSTEK